MRTVVVMGAESVLVFVIDELLDPILHRFIKRKGRSKSSLTVIAGDVRRKDTKNTWYIDIPGAPKCYRVDVGYLAANGKFFSLARSNTVTTPRPSNGDAVELIPTISGGLT